MTSRSYCFTSFKLNAITAFQKANKDDVTYFVAQHEIAPETNKEHIQGFIVFKKPVRMTAVKKILEDPAAHCETRKGTPQQVITSLHAVLCCAESGRGVSFCQKCHWFESPYQHK